MDDGRDPLEERVHTFPGPAFWSRIEALLTAVGLGSAKTIFKVRQVRARWEARREVRENLGRGVAYTHKACPACARLVTRGSTRCEYCGASVRWAPGPGLARTLGLVVPHGSVAMTIVTLNVLMYGITILVSSRTAETSLITAIFQPDLRSLYNLGALFGPSIINDHEVWRLWTYQFLHGGALHIFFNLYALLSLGPATEDVYGPSKTAALYWTTGLGAGVASFGTRTAFYFASGGKSHFPVMIGASGAIFGLIGLLIGHTYRRGGTQGANMRGFLMRWAVYGLVMGFVIPSTDNAAHVGGLATGFAIGLLVDDGSPREGISSLLWRVAALGAVGLTVYGYIAAAMAPHA